MDCPLTSITFDATGKVFGQTGAEFGMPIVNLQLSQGGPPCIYNNESFNNIGTQKYKFELFDDDYYGIGCDKIEFPVPKSFSNTDSAI